MTEADGFQDNRKVKVGFYDDDDDGVVDNPELFDIVVEPTLSETTKFVFFEKYLSYDTVERYRPYAATNFVVTEKESSIILNSSTYTDGQLFYFYDADEDVIKSYSSTTNTLTTSTDYIARRGRSSISFQYKHNAGQETRIDPSVSNIVDIYMLERTYDNSIQDMVTGRRGKTTDLYVRPTEDKLFRDSESLKSLSDQIVYHPVKYKILFGANADEQLQATFKVVKNTKTNVHGRSDQDKGDCRCQRILRIGQLGFRRCILLYRTGRLRTQSTCSRSTDSSDCAKPGRTEDLGLYSRSIPRQTRFLSVGPPLMMFQLLVH